MHSISDGAGRASETTQALGRSENTDETAAEDRLVTSWNEPANPATENEQLKEALATQPVIEQAKGMNLPARACDSSEAFATLQQVSQHNNVKLHDVAAVVVAAGCPAEQINYVDEQLVSGVRGSSSRPALHLGRRHGSFTTALGSVQRGQRGAGRTRMDDKLLPERDVARRVDDVTTALEQLTGALEQDEELTVVLQRVCHQVVHAVPDTIMASITLLRDDTPYTATSTGDDARRIDQAQYDAGNGPCLEAARTGQVQRVKVHEAVKQWPEFTAAADEAVISSYLSAPLFIDRQYQGSLNLYGTGDEGFGSLDAALLELYTTAAEASLRSARRYQSAQATVSQLHTALSTRAVIDQAKGILMALHRISADDAFDLLVTQSQQRNLKLRDVAERFVTDIVNTPS
ncbi:ANTAR domain-containing protein [Amycolatopsis sp. NPDC003865]